jgi:hypothetical protein
VSTGYWSASRPQGFSADSAAKRIKVWVISRRLTFD